MVELRTREPISMFVSPFLLRIIDPVRALCNMDDHNCGTLLDTSAVCRAGAPQECILGTIMQLWGNHIRKSARAIIIRDGNLLVFLRKRYSKVSGDWIEYYSIPGGGIDKNEKPEQAVVRELKEEMGVDIEVEALVAHRAVRRYEHYVYTAHIVRGEPALQTDSEEAATMGPHNQFIVKWVPVEMLSEQNLRYYSNYLGLIQQIARGDKLHEVLQISTD